MENENFDEDLKNRIKQVFEEYDDGQANEGWNLLREKYPKKNDRRYFFWWITGILLITALLIWFFQPEMNKLKAVKNVEKSKFDSAEMQVKADSIIAKPVLKKDSVQANQPEKAVVKTASAFTFKTKANQHKILNVTSKLTETIQANKRNDAVFIGIKLDSAAFTNHPISVSDFAKVDSVYSEKSPEIIQTQHSSTKPVTKKEVVKTALLKKLTPKTSRFGLSLYAGPHINFANGSNTLLGFGAGISADFSLNNRLKLATGLGLLYNKLAYQTKTNNNLYASLPANNASNSSGGIVTGNLVLSKLEAGLLQLDVPVNLVYEILPGKNSMAISAGLSSGTFAKESYQYSYTNPANDTHATKSFQSFYLLKTLNVAAKFGFPVSRYQLQIAPFVKLPLGNMATQQLKFGAAGINLEFKLQPFKK